MSDQDFSRREVLRNIGLSVTMTSMGANVVTAQDAEHVHHAVAADKASGAYRPKAFNAHEWATLRRLAELIMPADEHSKGALDAGAPEFVDTLAANNSELAEIYTGGIAWLDRQMQKRDGAIFLDAIPAQQTAMLDLIAFRKNAETQPELGPGIKFFSWVRNMVVDAYFTSKAGMDYLGFMGNGAVAKFEVPAEAIAYAIKRSPFA